MGATQQKDRKVGWQQVAKETRAQQATPRTVGKQRKTKVAKGKVRAMGRRVLQVALDGLHDALWEGRGRDELQGLGAQRRGQEPVELQEALFDVLGPGLEVVQDGHHAPQAVLRDGGGLLDPLQGHLQGKGHNPDGSPPLDQSRLQTSS